MVETGIDIKQNQQEGFDLIWQRFPERNIASSSVWWYIMLMPEQAEGYGPMQAMFSLIAMAGDSFQVNKVRHPGYDRKITLVGDEEQLNTTALGWYFDGQTKHKNLVHEDFSSVLSPHGSVRGWKEAEDGKKVGGEFSSYGDRPFGIRGEFVGANGGALFEAWGDPRSDSTSPGFVYDYDYKIGGFHVVSWRHLHFAGEITSPNGTEAVAGIGYFQRVCFNVPLFPWKWIWTSFADGSFFSCTIPYAGLQLLRRRDRFYPDVLERATLPVIRGGFFHWADGCKETVFSKSTVIPRAGVPYPSFAVECFSKTGDHIRFDVVPYSHLQYLLNRPILGGHAKSCFNYNEFPFRVANLEGVVDGRVINRQTLGEGFGNCEYTWGLFL
jgi:hypothetical protein